MNFVLGHLWFQVAMSPMSWNQNKNKVRGYGQAQKSIFWQNRTAPSKFLDCTGLVIFSPRHNKVSNLGDHQSPAVFEWLFGLRDEARFFPLRGLDSILPMIDGRLLGPNQLAPLRNQLAMISENATGSHGDFHIGNLLVTQQNQILASDLDCFHLEGFLFFDLIHFYVVALSKQYSKSWVEIIEDKVCVDELWSSLFRLDFVLREYHLTYYLVVRCDLEFRVQGRMDRLSGYKKIIARWVENTPRF